VNALEDTNHYGCEALGKAGAFTVEVLSGSDGKLWLTIESPEWDFVFELVSPATVGDLAAFLRRYTGRAEFAELVLGSFCGATVEIVKDDEFEDRFILRTLGDDVVIFFKMLGDVTDDFVAAVLQAAEEFEN
jgi:hypothetical protein